MREELSFKFYIRNDGDVPVGPFNLQDIFGNHAHQTNEVTLDANTDVSFDVKFSGSVDLLQRRFYEKTASLGLPTHLVTLTWLYVSPPPLEKPKDYPQRDMRPGGFSLQTPPPPPPVVDEEPAEPTAADPVLP